MKIKSVLNANKKEITSGKFNIFIPISIGNKWFTEKNLSEYLDLALKYTREKVAFLIADKIQAINYDARSNNKKEYNFRRALENGAKMEALINGLISRLPKEKREKIKVFRWEDLEKKDMFYDKYTPVIYDEFEKNKEFKDEIMRIVKSSIRDRKFTEEKYLELSKYVIEEFTLTYCGINLEGERFGVYFYPHLFPITSFIERIQKGEIFTSLKSKLPKEQSGLVIVS